MTAHCKSCGAEIRWVEMAKSGARMPVDARGEQRIVLGRSGKAHVVETFVSHFATCPDADKHRQGKLGL